MPIRIAFLAVTQAHQFLHWIPAALRLAREPDVEVAVFGSTRAGLDFIRSYDTEGRLKLERLWTPSFESAGLFTPPRRRLALLTGAWKLARYPVLVTTEATSSLLYGVPGFRSRIVHLKHGAGDREGGYNPKHAKFDLTLVNGPKDKERLIARGLASESDCIVVGYGKFELVRPPVDPLFANVAPIALYNPHFDEQLGSWFRHGPEIVTEMERITDWNFVVAPHVKVKNGPDIRARSPNVLIDHGSVRSIDMTYTESATVYVGDISSQVYEFLRRPRPCIFLNLDRIDWRENENYAHWHLGQVIERVEDFGPALKHAQELQPKFRDAQREMLEKSVDPSPVPASERQARIILDFAMRVSARR
jgi:hypothetical protein